MYILGNGIKGKEWLVIKNEPNDQIVMSNLLGVNLMRVPIFPQE